MKRKILSMVAGYPAAMFSFVGAAEPPAPILEALVSESYPMRIEGLGELEDWAKKNGAEGEAWLVDTLATADDPELGGGAESVLRALVLEKLTRERPGFVGVRMQEVGLADDRFGIVVSGVEPGTPAERAGLVAGDTIVGLDGGGWSGPDAPDEFAREVAGRKAGDRVVLEVVDREGKLRELGVELMARPWDKGEYGVQRGRLNRIPNADEARDQAFHDWLRERMGEEDGNQVR